LLHPAPDPTGPGVQIILTYLPQLLLTHYTKYIERLLREAFVVCGISVRHRAELITD